jgi:small-conductance mechanosensitive channel
LESKPAYDGDMTIRGEADYLMLIKTRPGKQYDISRELRRRIKEEFTKQNIKTPGPGRPFVVDQNAPALS